MRRPRSAFGQRARTGGATVETTRDNLGHASLVTTTVYVTTEKKRRMKEVQAESGVAGAGDRSGRSVLRKNRRHATSLVYTGDQRT
jgi:hypothetical protein